jgi:hypothetical protein
MSFSPNALSGQARQHACATCGHGFHLARFSGRFAFCVCREVLNYESVTFGLLADGCDEPQVVERRWPEAVDQAPHVAHRILRLILQAREQILCVPWLAPDQLARRVELQGQARERGAQPVVQVASQAPPLLLSGCDQEFAGALQIGGEPDGVHGPLNLAGEVLQQAAVGI